LIYTATRLLAPFTALMLWAWFADGTVSDPVNLLLLFALATGVLGLAAVRRYWRIRKTSRSRRDSSLLT
jgi:hypothetical protein